MWSSNEEQLAIYKDIACKYPNPRYEKAIKILTDRIYPNPSWGMANWKRMYDKKYYQDITIEKNLIKQGIL